MSGIEPLSNTCLFIDLSRLHHSPPVHQMPSDLPSISQSPDPAPLRTPGPLFPDSAPTRCLLLEVFWKSFFFPTTEGSLILFCHCLSVAFFFFFSSPRCSTEWHLQLRAVYYFRCSRIHAASAKKKKNKIPAFGFRWLWVNCGNETAWETFFHRTSEHLNYFCRAMQMTEM